MIDARALRLAAGRTDLDGHVGMVDRTGVAAAGPVSTVTVSVFGVGGTEVFVAAVVPLPPMQALSKVAVEQSQNWNDAHRWFLTGRPSGTRRGHIRAESTQQDRHGRNRLAGDLPIRR